VIVGVVVSETEEIVGEVSRSGLIEQLWLCIELRNVGGVPLTGLSVFLSAVEGTVGVHEVGSGGDGGLVSVGRAWSAVAAELVVSWRGLLTTLSPLALAGAEFAVIDSHPPTGGHGVDSLTLLVVGVVYHAALHLGVVVGVRLLDVHPHVVLVVELGLAHRTHVELVLDVTTDMFL